MMHHFCGLCQAIKNDKKDTINVLELYSGIGGMHYGLLDSGILNLGKLQWRITAIDINPNANSVYEYNFMDSSKVISKNLVSISANELNELKIDICTMSPPCQPFTRQHTNQKLEDSDHRTESLNQLITHVFPKLTNKPKYFLVENVKNFEKSKIASKLLEMFDKMNYNYQQFLLQPFQFGIPNSRLRYYCLAREGDFCFSTVKSIVEEYPSLLKSERLCKSCMSAYFLTAEQTDCYEIEKFELNRIADYLEEDVSNEMFKLKQETVQKYLPAIDIVNRNAKSSNCFTSSYGNYLTGTGSFLLMDELSSNELIELKKRPDASNLSLRKFTPKEIANLMGFPANFKLPAHITLKQSYKLIGNSVNVRVISHLLKILLLNESVNDLSDKYF